MKKNALRRQLLRTAALSCRMSFLACSWMIGGVAAVVAAAECVGTKGDGIEDGEDGFEEANHVVVHGRADDGGVAPPRCFEQGDDVRGGQHDGNGKLGKVFKFPRTITYEEERHFRR